MVSLTAVRSRISRRQLLWGVGFALAFGFFGGSIEPTAAAITRTVQAAPNSFTAAQPWKPGDLTATLKPTGRIDISWAGLPWASGGYQVYRSASGSGTLVPLATVSTAASGYSDASTVDGISYTYSVSGINSRGMIGPAMDSNQVTADATPPVLATTVSPALVGSASAYSTVTFAVTASEALSASPAITITGSCIETVKLSLSPHSQAATYSGSYTVPPATAGSCIASVAANGTDLAGNQSVGGSANFAIDATPPTLVTSATPDPVNAGSAATITVSSSEALAGPPSVTVSGSCLAPTAVSMSPAGQANSYSGTYVAPSLASACAATVSATGADLVGNQGAAGPYSLTINAAALPITFRGAVATTAPTSSPTSITVNRPSGVVANDVMVAQVFILKESRTISAPSGWTTLASYSASPFTEYIFYKVAGASEPASYTFTFSTNVPQAGAAIAAYYNVNLANPINAVGAFTAGSKTSAITAASVQTTASNALLVGIYAVGKNGAGNITIGDAQQALRWTNSANLPIAGADRTQSTPGATGNLMATSPTVDPNLGILIALTPAR